jgi:hypothetical protein
MCRHNHGPAVDYYALGILTFEMIFGKVKEMLLTILETLPWKNKKGTQRKGA